MRRAQTLLETKPAEAIHEFELAGKAGADALEVKKGLGIAHERLKKYDEALRLLREVTAKKPDDVAARLVIANIEVMQKHFDAARADLEATLRHEPPDAASLLIYAALARTPAQGKAGLESLGRLDKTQFAPLLGSAEYAFARASFQAATGDAVGAEATLAGANDRESIAPIVAIGLAEVSRTDNRARFAEWLLSRASNTRTATDAVHMALAELALSQRHPSIARAAISKLPTELKPDPKALLLLAQYHDEMNDQTERARATLRALEAIPPKDETERRRVTMLYATALDKSGNAEKAAKVLDALLDRHPDFPPAVLLLANLRLNQKQADVAIKLAEKLEKDVQLRTEAYQILVAAQLLKKSPTAAEAAARRFLASSSSSPDSIMLLVNLLVHLKQPAQALREVEAGLVRHPNLGELLTARITLTERVRGFDKAEKLALEALRANNPRAPRELASLYERNKRYEQALKIYRDLAKTEPKALMELSQLQDRMGKLDDALASIRELSNAEPYNVNALGQLGTLEGRLGQLDASRRTFERVLAVEPESIWALNNLAMLLADVPGETQHAVDLARRAYALAGADVRIGDTLGWALVKNKNKADRREAIQLLERSADAMRTAEADFHYGAALAAAGKYAEAKVALEKAVRSDGKSSWLAESKQLLAEALRHLAEASPQAAQP